MRWALALSVLTLVALFPSLQAAPNHKSTGKSSHAQSQSTPGRTAKSAATGTSAKNTKKASAGMVSLRTASSSAGAKGRFVRGRNSKKNIALAPSYQLHPDQDRYMEIQKALTDKGYFTGEVNGQWGDDSVDALKRFQADQKLPNDGKINALSLAGLGLGPKHGVTVATSSSSASPTTLQLPPAASDTAAPQNGNGALGSPH